LTFLRVVEVFPPVGPALPSDGRRNTDGLERLSEGLVKIERYADVILVANVKNPALLKADTVHTAVELQERLRVGTAATVVVRDQNRAQFDTAVFTAFSARMDSLFLAWGDDYPPSSKITNVRDFARLADAIRRAALIRSKAGATTRLFAPIDIRRLASSEGVSLAEERLRAGADMLLAQPPTTDPGDAFDAHAALVESAGVKDKVLLNVFPFRNPSDVKRYERLFGWRHPDGFLREASRGERRLDQLAREVVRRLRAERYPGVYLVARSDPTIASRLLA
jgi:hypothetical protein